MAASRRAFGRSSLSTVDITLAVRCRVSHTKDTITSALPHWPTIDRRQRPSYQGTAFPFFGSSSRHGAEYCSFLCDYLWRMYRWLRWPCSCYRAPKGDGARGGHVSLKGNIRPQLRRLREKVRCGCLRAAVCTIGEIYEQLLYVLPLPKYGSARRGISMKIWARKE